MIRINERFDNREQAQAYMDRMYRDYHPCGYGTSLTITENAKGFTVAGSRYRSCD